MRSSYVQRKRFREEYGGHVNVSTEFLLNDCLFKVGTVFPKVNGILFVSQMEDRT